MSKKVLIVDDSEFIRATIKTTLLSGGYQIVGEASTGSEAIEMAFDLEPDIITMDNILPDMIGTDVMKVYVEEGLSSKVILISAIGQEHIIQDGLKLGAKAYLTKPFTSEQLIETMNKL